MNKINQNQQKHDKNDKQIITYKVKEENINKMHEYLKKQSNKNG